MSKGASDFGHKPAGKQRYVICKRCGGTGSITKYPGKSDDIPNAEFKFVGCPECQGWGYTFGEFDKK